MKSALAIESGAELEQFDLGEVVIGHTTYTILTGHEGTGRCFWCGGELKGKLKRYCYGHMKEYYNHFNWGDASREAKKRANYKCENCGRPEGQLNGQTNLKVHHIVPLKGKPRFFSAFNLPWNLVALCHDCHVEIHRTPPKLELDSFEVARLRGQGIMELLAC